MSVQESYLRARSTSNLKSGADVDILGAAGMAAQAKDTALGGALFNCIGRRTSQDLYDAHEGLRLRLRTHMLAKRIKGDAELIVTQTIGWWLNSGCKACLGQRFELNEGTPTLSSRYCKACKGSGKSAMKVKSRELSEWVIALIERLISAHGSKVQEKRG